MNVGGHLEKISRLNALRSRLDPIDDFELWFWAGMTAGTHAVNAALHHAGITDDADMFATQPGVYLVRQSDDSWRPAFRPLGDVLHVGRPKVDGPVPDGIAAMMHAMETVEQHRDPCLRGRRAATPQIVRQCSDALADCFRHLETQLAGDAR
ncbi:MAG: hypothetical protein KIT85_11030 [Pseudolabrys sp.]|nr:hypothetical protein [Pseudolabrys sp.]